MQSTQALENSQGQHNNYLTINSTLKILYNSDYSSNDFPAKFENEEVKKICCKKHFVKKSNSNELAEIKENPDNHIQPLDIVKIFKIYIKANSKQDYWVHAIFR